MKPPWTAEVAVSPDLARSLVERQFPELAPVNIAPLGTGWDNTAYLVNRNFVFRFPRRQLGAACLENEIRVLPGIAGRLPLPIPDPTFVGTGVPDFPWKFAGYQWLKGRTACGLALDERDRAAIAAPLGEFLAALHSIGPEEATRLGAPLETLGRLDPVRRVPQAQEGLEKLVRLGLIPGAAPFFRIVQETATTRPAQANALVHGDFYVRHILIGDAGRPSGIIDWGDVHLGDVALDLSVAHTFLPPSAHDAFRRTYGPIEEPTWRLARFRALQYGIHLSDYGHATGDRDIEREGLLALEHVLQS